MSDPTNLLITVPFADEHIAALQKRFPALNITLHPNAQDEPISDELWAQTEILYTHRVLPEVEQAPKLRWIQFHIAGVDRYIHLPIIQSENTVVSTLSGANAPQTAEHALALLLALSHNIPNMLSDQSRSKWSARRLERYKPRELYGSTVGIVGYGSVGQQLARLLQSFNTTILASKRDLVQADEDEYHIGDAGGNAEDLVRRLYPGKALRSMFKDCDFVVVCVPLNKETSNMIGAQQLKALKPHAYLVDVSRGSVLDHKALIEALKNEQFAGAALDVFPEEPLPADSPLWDMPNVLISPHVAGLSPHYEQRALELFTANLDRYLAGEDVLNQVDIERGY